MESKQSSFLTSRGQIEGSVVAVVQEEGVRVELSKLLNIKGDPDTGLVRRILNMLRQKEAKDVVDAVEQIRD